MASTFRSHFSRRTSQHEEPVLSQPRRPSSRPQPKSSSEDGAQQGKPAQLSSKLKKRASRSFATVDKPERSVHGTARTTPAGLAQSGHPSASKRSLVTPLSEAQSSRTGAGQSLRHNGLPPPPIMRTPSLVSGSSVSTFDSPRSVGLRRKPSTIDKYAAQKKAESGNMVSEGSTVHRRNDDYSNLYDDAILGISLPPSSTCVAIGHPTSADTRTNTPQVVSDKEWYTTTYPSPMPSNVLSATPSTFRTDSPWSHAPPTPSTVSSYSSGTAVTTGPPNRKGYVVPSSSHVTEATRTALRPVRESSTSSSNSTVKTSSQKRDIFRKTPSAPPTGRPSLATRSASRDKVALSRSKDQSTTLAKGDVKSKRSVQIPPELAHLNVESPPKGVASNKPLPPMRPSRDGTPNLSDVGQPSPVVQSDLPPVYTTYHKRTPSQEIPASPTMKSRFGMSSKSPAKHASPRVDSAISPPPSARIFARGPTPELPAPEPRRLLRKDSPAVAPSPSPSKSHRFGIFSRKPKADQPQRSEVPKREARKGPSAGTGHEGYGRFGIRGRSGSTVSSAGVRSPSADSTTSSVPPPRSDASRKTSTGSRKSSINSAREAAELDEFLKERLNPVILRGSGSTISNMASSSDQPSVSIPTSSTASLEGVTKPQLLPSAMRHSKGVSPMKRPHIGHRTQSDSSEDGMNFHQPSLAARRSFARLSRADSRSPSQIPVTIITDLPIKSASVDSYDGEGSSWSRITSAIPAGDELVESAEGKEGLWLRPQHAMCTADSVRKWNFLERAQSSPQPVDSDRITDSPDCLPPSPLEDLAYQGATQYDLLDPVSPISLEEVEAIAHESETFTTETHSKSHVFPKMVPYEGRHASMLPSPAQNNYIGYSNAVAPPEAPQTAIRQDSAGPADLLRVRTVAPPQTAHLTGHQGRPITPVVYDGPSLSQERSGIGAPNTTPELASVRFATPVESNTDSPTRQPRLSPIGRIPRVVSKRDRDRRLPDTSFSRPFVRNQPNPSVKPPGTLYNQIRELASPIESGSHPVSITSIRSDGASADPNCISYTSPPSLSTAPTSVDIPNSKDFFAFPQPRKNSNVSYSSSSSSWMQMYAVPSHQVDDPWNEFDDLLDDMLPNRAAVGSSIGASYLSSTPLYTSSPSMPAPLNVGYQSPPPTTRLPSPPGVQVVTSVLSVPQQIARFMQPSMSPLATPYSLSEFVDRYSARSTSTIFSDPSRTSFMQPSRGSITQQNRVSTVSARGSSSSRNSRASVHSRSASLPEAEVWNSRSSVAANARFNRDTQLLGIAEDDIDETASRANLRFGALMTSKWLSFGRVLFSPAHNEMRLADGPRVLVLDGLGSDWSYYVALSYPSAAVYNLGPAPVRGSTAWPGVNQKPPINHKHYSHEGIDSAFPFPKGFFTAVVFRFPIAASEEAYNACMFECKRVLRPGGYLEVAVLDLDLMNMGNKARKAVRDLKTRMQFNDQSVSLRNMSDVLVRCIGRRGFEDVQRCIVGVPTAGRIPRNQDASSDSSQSEERSHSKNFKVELPDPEINFSDLLQDSRNSQYEPGNTNNDESITKMVARVGRWWYSTCYEKQGLNNDTSIWNDQSLLREAEKQGTSFKLLICHAQKPIQTRRRTVSV